MKRNLKEGDVLIAIMRTYDNKGECVLVKARCEMRVLNINDNKILLEEI